MTVLLCVAAAILLLLTAFLLSYVAVTVRLTDGFFLKIKLAGIKLFEIKPEENKKSSTDDTVSDKKAENEIDRSADGIIASLKKKYGFTGAIKQIFGFLSEALTRIKKNLRHIKIKNVRLSVTIAAENAAATAVDYGIVCSAVYPVLTLLNSCIGADFKKIDIKSDFTSNKPQLAAEADLKLRMLFLIGAAYGIYSEYKNFVSKENFNERK